MGKYKDMAGKGNVAQGLQINYLWMPKSYYMATEAKIDEICNGCGPQSWKYDLVSDRFFGLCITDCCNVHDWMYCFGDATDNGKKLADRVFLNNMIRKINYQKSWRITKWFRRRKAKAYYLAVKYFGGSAYWANKNRGVDKEG